MCLSLAWLQWPSQLEPRPNMGQTDKVSTIDMETIISRFYHIIQMIVTHSAIHLVCCCHGQMSLITVSYPIIFIHACPIHNPANSFTSSCTNLTYPITIHADCKSMNLINHLQCTECNAFTLEKPAVPFLTVSMNIASPPQYPNQTCQLPFTPNPTRSLSRNAGL